MLLGAAGESGGGGIDAVLPSGAELFFGALMFIIVAVIVIITVALVKRFSSTRNDELEHWRERALRAEAERDLFKEQGADDSTQTVR